MSQPLPTSLRERKKARTREALIRAAFQLFQARGFEATTVDQIADAAEVSRSTFFRYFATKESVVFPGQQARLARFEELLTDRREGESPFAAIQRVLLQFAAEYMADRDQVVEQDRIVKASAALRARDTEFDSAWERLIADALFERHGWGSDDGWRARVEAAAVFGAVRATMREWLDGGGQADLVELGRRSFGLLAAGLDQP